jgi:hypothetical protein
MLKQNRKGIVIGLKLLFVSDHSEMKRIKQMYNYTVFIICLITTLLISLTTGISSSMRRLYNTFLLTEYFFAVCKQLTYCPIVLPFSRVSHKCRIALSR